MHKQIANADNNKNNYDTKPICEQMINIKAITQKTAHCKPGFPCFNELRNALINLRDVFCDLSNQPNPATNDCYAFYIKEIVVGLLESIANILVDVKGLYKNGLIPCTVIQVFVDHADSTLTAIAIALRSVFEISLFLFSIYGKFTNF